MNPNHYFNFDLIFFDCDSTLSSIEGIDELAKLAGKEAEIAELTNLAMDGKIDLSEVYGKRLALIQPTRAQLAQIEQRYWETQVEDAKAVIDALHFLKKQVFIISGGLAQPVKGFAYRLGIPPERVQAVEVSFNALSGEWWQYHDPSKLAQQKFMDYYEGHLTISSGKPKVVDEMAQGLHGKRLFIGDGASDLATRGVVDLFVGFGGVVARENVRKDADVWLEAQSLAPLLPLATGALGYARCVGTVHQAVFERGIALTQTHLFRIQNENIQNAFEEAFALL
ncbi:MAG: HAD-IB family phosphatase [Phototrophicaceae bacterium]